MRSPGSQAKSVRTCQVLRPRPVAQALALARCPIALTQALGQPGVVEEPGMCGRSLLGNREISWLASATCVQHWSVSGRRGAVADDVRSGEVCRRHSSCEAEEQSRATGCGGGGAKGGGRGECESAKHGPGTVPGNRVTGAEAHTASCKAKEEGEVHRALPSRQY